MEDVIKSILHPINICCCLRTATGFQKNCNSYNLYLALKNDQIGPHSFSPLLDNQILKSILQNAIGIASKSLSRASRRTHASKIFDRLQDPTKRNVLIQLLYPEYNSNDISQQQTSTPSMNSEPVEPIIIEDEFLNDIIPEGNIEPTEAIIIEDEFLNDMIPDHVVCDKEQPGSSRELRAIIERQATSTHLKTDAISGKPKKPSENQRKSLRIMELRQSERMRQTTHRAEISETKKQELREQERMRHVTRKLNTKPPVLAATPQSEVDSMMPYNFGQLDSICEHCGSMNFELEKVGPINDRYFNLCCHRGKILLPKRNPVHPYIEDLMTSQTEESKHFMEYIRSYNSALAFVSYTSDIEAPRRSVNALPRSGGPYSFVAHGGLYHYVSSAEGGRNPMYGSLYYYDSETALKYRLGYARNPEQLNINILTTFDALIRQYNPHAKNYQLMHEKVDEQNRLAAELGIHQPQVRMVIVGQGGANNGRYNIPTASDVAGVFVVDEDGAPSLPRGIHIYQRGGKLRKVSILNQSLDSLAYPFIFLQGELGYSPGSKHQGIYATEKRNLVTYNEYASSKISILPGFSALHNAGKLFQQYLVDIALRIEYTRLNFIRSSKGQNQIRSEDYTSLKEYVERKATNAGMSAGKQVILPSSFTGGPRYMRQLYLDAMSLCAEVGNPSLFLTFSFNPKCQAMLAALKPHEHSSNRPDLVARIFNLQLKELLDDLTVKEIFGPHAGCLYVVEFQKRGLPHAHILLTLQSQITDSEIIDQIISAEVPDPIATPNLYEKVKQHMLHRPCGRNNRHAPCNNEEGNCKKGFPKDECHQTNANAKGYPKYRRRINHLVKYGEYQLDSRSVVPYNPYLLQKYDSHINLEVCSSIKAVKYIHKYIYKGYDAASLNLTRTTGVAQEGSTPETLVYDEVQNFIDSRYLGSPEACYRIFNFKLHGSSHSVSRLWVHCENMQTITFEEGKEEEALARNKTTTLLAYFKLNSEDANARQYLYHEIPKHYVFDQRERENSAGEKSKEWAWFPRKRGGQKMIGRMHEVPIRDSERFHLRILLQNVRGARSYDEIKKVNGIQYNTFQEACKELGLIDDGKIWINTLREAVVFKMDRELRRLFVNILVFNRPPNSLELWNLFHNDFIRDYMKYYNQDHPLAINSCLQSIKRQLSTFGETLENFNLPLPRDHVTPRLSKDNMYDRQTQENDGEISFSKLTLEQKCIVNFIVILFEQSMVDGNEELPHDKIRTLSKFVDVSGIRTVSDLRNKITRCIFVEASAGCGKTTIYRCLLQIARGLGLTAVCTAYTGLAALLLPGGKTSHSTFMLPRIMLGDSVSSMKAQSPRAELLRKAELIIWDECPTAPKITLKIVDHLLRDLMKIDKPFGDKLVVLGGDFRQCLPIVAHGSRSQQVGASIKKSHLWSHFTTARLLKNMRSEAGAEEFSKFVLGIGDGTIHFEEDGVRILGDNAIEIPPQCVVEGSIVEKVFGKEIDTDNNAYQHQVILTTTNELSFKINEEVLDLIGGEVTEFLSRDSAEVNEGQICYEYPNEFLHSLTPSGMAPHRLRLKIGALVMLICNFDDGSGLCNGTRLRVEAMFPHVIKAKVLTEGWTDTYVLIPKILMKKSDDLPFTLSRVQFPIRLCFSMTINKAQGQSFQKVGIYLPQSVFSHGQLFVGMSRARSFEGLFVKIEQTHNQGVYSREGLPDVHYTQNIVYTEILNDGLDLEEVVGSVVIPQIDDPLMSIQHFVNTSRLEETIPQFQNEEYEVEDTYTMGSENEDEHPDDTIAEAQHEVYEGEDTGIIGSELNDVVSEDHILQWGDEYSVHRDEQLNDIYDESEDIESFFTTERPSHLNFKRSASVEPSTRKRASQFVLDKWNGFPPKKRRHYSDSEVTVCRRNMKRQANISIGQPDDDIHYLSKRMKLVHLDSLSPENQINHPRDFLKQLDRVWYFNRPPRPMNTSQDIDAETSLRIATAQDLITRHSNRCPEPYDLSLMPDPNRIPTLYEQSIPFLNNCIPTVWYESNQFARVQIPADTQLYHDHRADAIFTREKIVSTQILVQPHYQLSSTRTATLDRADCLRTSAHGSQLESSATATEMQQTHETRAHFHGILDTTSTTWRPETFGVVTQTTFPTEDIPETQPTISYPNTSGP